MRMTEKDILELKKEKKKNKEKNGKSKLNTLAENIYKKSVHLLNN